MFQSLADRLTYPLPTCPNLQEVHNYSNHPAELHDIFDTHALLTVSPVVGD